MIEFLGWFGTTLYLINHVYLSFCRDWRRGFYYSGNLIAASSLVASSAYLQSWQAVAINAFWAIISILILFKLNLRKLPLTSRRFILLFLVTLLICVVAYLKAPDQIWNLVSWIAAVLFSLSYLMFSAAKMPARYYQLCNFFAAGMCLPALWIQANYAVFALEVAWAFISIWAAVRQFNEAHIID